MECAGLSHAPGMSGEATLECGGTATAFGYRVGRSAWSSCESMHWWLRAHILRTRVWMVRTRAPSAAIEKRRLSPPHSKATCVAPKTKRRPLQVAFRKRAW